MILRRKIRLSFLLDDGFQGNAENSTMIMVGDVLKKTSAVFGDGMWDVEDFSRSMCGSDSSCTVILFMRIVHCSEQLALCLNFLKQTLTY